MHRLSTIFACLICVCLAAGPLSAGVVVVQNWTSVKMTFTAQASDGQQMQYAVASKDIAAIPTDGPVTITFGEGAAAVVRTVPMNSIYYIGVADGKPELAIGSGEFCVRLLRSLPDSIMGE